MSFYLMNLHQVGDYKASENRTLRMKHLDILDMTDHLFFE